MCEGPLWCGRPAAALFSLSISSYSRLSSAIHGETNFLSRTKRHCRSFLTVVIFNIGSLFRIAFVCRHYQLPLEILGYRRAIFLCRVIMICHGVGGAGIRFLAHMHNRATLLEGDFVHQSLHQVDPTTVSG